MSKYESNVSGNKLHANLVCRASELEEVHTRFYNAMFLFIQMIILLKVLS